MTRQTFWVALTLLLGLAARGDRSHAVHASEMPQLDSAGIRKGVQAALDAYRELSAAGKWEALVRLYADDPRFLWVSNGAVEARSVGEIRQHFLALPPGTHFEITYQTIEIAPLAPDVAQVATPFQTRIIDPKGEGFTFGGYLTMTMVARPDGWKILGGHSSSPVRRGS